MYIFKNALRCVKRGKGRSVLIGIVVMLLSVSSCLGLSIRESNRTLKKQYADDMEISATLNKKGRNGDSISLEALESYGKKDTVKNFYKTASLYFSAGSSIEPLDVAGSFKMNKDFKDKYGDVKNGEKKTTSSSESASGTVYTGGGDVLLLTDEKTTESTGESQNQGESESSEDSQKEGKESGGTSSEKTESTEDSEPSKGNNTSDGESSNTAEPNQKNNAPNGDNNTSKPDNSDKETQQQPNGEKQFPFNNFNNGNGNSAGNGKGSTNSGSGKKSAGKSNNWDSDSVPQPPVIRGGDTFISNEYFFNMASMNDFTLKGYNSADGMPQYVSELSALSFEKADYKCVISKNLADENKLTKGKTFTLKNPENEDETYKFTIVGICDTSSSADTKETSSNASFEDNCIYVNDLTVQDIVTKSDKKNGDKKSENNSEKKIALTPTYSGKFTFANLSDYNTFKDGVEEDLSLVSEDVEVYEESISQLEVLGKYATYFLIVIFIIGAFVLVIINIFSIRNRKYEIGVLTAIGMKKYKVALQFIIELFVVTFAALIVGSTAGAAVSVPVTNKLLQTVNESKTQSIEDEKSVNAEMKPEENADNNMQNTEPPKMKADGKGFGNLRGRAKNYVAKVNSAANLTVVLKMIIIGMALTVISGMSAMIFIMRYEPLKILSNRD